MEPCMCGDTQCPICGTLQGTYEGCGGENARRAFTDLPTCPGCGARADEGLTLDCNHPEGCGYFLNFLDSPPENPAASSES